MSKDLQKKEAAAAVTAEMMAEFGTPEISSSDVVIPKILCMQGLSERVIEGLAKFGDFVDSLSGEVLGNINGPAVEFTPFYLHKIWITSKFNGKKYEFDNITDVTASNDNKAWEEDVNGVMYKNEKCFNFYVLKGNDATIPYIISFKGTSLKAGRELATQMYLRNKAERLTPASKTMSLGGHKVANDKGTYAVLKVSVLENSSMETIQDCLKWLKTIKNEEVKTDNTDLGPAGQQTQPELF